ncbi:hypothetical protein [Sphingobium aquiterrae]|uniref:hypothetical protein n=1 Tax=Sphingobium aquiterrae TaxID=2038656 RepID=UPI0030181F9F
MTFTAFLPWLYLASLVGAGWRLFTLRWRRWQRVLAGVMLAITAPMLFIVPALLNPMSPIADLQMAMGVGMLVAGVVALTCGVALGWFWARRAA